MFADHRLLKRFLVLKQDPEDKTGRRADAWPPSERQVGNSDTTLPQTKAGREGGLRQPKAGRFSGKGLGEAEGGPQGPGGPAVLGGTGREERARGGERRGGRRRGPGTKALRGGGDAVREERRKEPGSAGWGEQGEPPREGARGRPGTARLLRPLPSPGQPRKPRCPARAGPLPPPRSVHFRPRRLTQTGPRRGCPRRSGGRRGAAICLGPVPAAAPGAQPPSPFAITYPRPSSPSGRVLRAEPPLRGGEGGDPGPGRLTSPPQLPAKPLRGLRPPGPGRGAGGYSGLPGSKVQSRRGAVREMQLRFLRTLLRMVPTPPPELCRFRHRPPRRSEPVSLSCRMAAPGRRPPPRGERWPAVPESSP